MFSRVNGKHSVTVSVVFFRQDRASLSEQCKKNITRVSRLKAKLQEEKSRMRRIKNIMPEAALYLRHALMVKRKRPDPERPTSETSGHANMLTKGCQLYQPNGRFIS